MAMKLLLLLIVSCCCVTLQDQSHGDSGTAHSSFTCSEDDESCKMEDKGYIGQLMDSILSVNWELKMLNLKILMYITLLFLLLCYLQHRHTVEMFKLFDEQYQKLSPPPPPPFKPVVFSAELSKQQRGENMIIIFDRVVANIGGGYDKQTGRFRAPHPGTYSFSAMSDSETKTCFYISSKSKPAYADRLAETPGLMTARTSVVLDLKRGDPVFVYLLFGDFRGNDHQVHSSFTGIRLA